MMQVQAKVEVFSWKEANNVSLLMKHEPGAPSRESWQSVVSENWESPVFERKWVVPLWRIPLGGRNMSCPNHPQQFISKVRYPKTWNVSIPWKVSCLWNWLWTDDAPP